MRLFTVALRTLALSTLALLAGVNCITAQEKTQQKTQQKSQQKSQQKVQQKSQQKSAGGVEDNFAAIFNGKDLDGWKGNLELWSVEDGLITGRTTAEKPLKFNTFLIYDKGPVANFELRLDYKIDAGNSGIQYRSKIIDAEKFIVGGYQADIEAGPKYTGINYEERGRGILAERGQRVTIAADGSKSVESFGDGAELVKKLSSDSWNHYRIVANGNKLSHYINDELMSEVIDHQADKAATSGVLALQIHQGPPMVIQFKNVRIKTLD